MKDFLDIFFSIGTIGMQVLLLAILIFWHKKTHFTTWVADNTHTLLRFFFVGGAIGSLIYQYVLLYPPCLLCWYQRIAIFPIAILAFTGDIRTNKLLRIQTIILSSIGFIIAVFHNIIDIFPTGLDTCGANGPSCLARYVYEFGYITIPMMSATLLLFGMLLPILARRYPQGPVAADNK